jgi:hypothetical protein
MRNTGDRLKTTPFPDGYWLDVARNTVHPETRLQIDKNDPNWTQY